MVDLSNGEIIILILANVLVLIAVAKWYVDEASGKNYYKSNPQAKAFEDGIKSRALTVENYGDKLSKVDWNTSKESQVGQIEDLCRSELSKK